VHQVAGVSSLICALLLVLVASIGWAADLQARQDLTGISLEELMAVEVTTVSRKPEKLSEVADAIYVITQEDIRRSGVTSIPEALRLAPDVQVARIDANKWAIGVRGFSSRLSRSLLVLIDGRSVYSPLFAGVYWEVQDTLLEDIERIEVIRGPGGALWGANAVNGIINIITKRAKDTQGGLLTAGGGSEEQGFGGFRYGGEIGHSLYYRVYGKFFNRDAGFHRNTSDFDDWYMGQGGFRADWEGQAGDTLTLQGDIYSGKSGQRTAITTFSPPFLTIVEEDADLSGGNILGRWQHMFNHTSDLVLQLYYDRTYRREPNLREARDTFDVDFQHRFALPWRQEIIWGLGYRLTADDTSAVSTVVFMPKHRTDHLFSAFVQDEIVLVTDRLRLTIGSKFEHNDYSGFEAQPSGRLLWTPTPWHTLWGSITRAVRTPSRVEHDLALTGLADPTIPAFTRLLGNEEFDAEKVLAYQLGYRVQPMPGLFLDIAAFYQQYTNLLSLEPGMSFTETSPLPAHTVRPLSVQNKLHGEVYGVELASDWQVFDWWRLAGVYAYLQINLHRDTDSLDLTTAAATEGASPQHQASLRSFMTLPGNLEFDLVWRYVDSLSSQSVGSYFNLDARLGWHPNQNLEIAVVGQNLLEDHHPEFGGGSGGLTEVERSVYGKMTWRW
jgi:iron complex outermembrane receptor protein